MTDNRRDVGYIRGCCAAFVQSLLDKQLTEHSEVFILLDEEAQKRGFVICARQQGIRGTFLSFSPRSDFSEQAVTTKEEDSKSLAACRDEGRWAFQRGEPCHLHVWTSGSAGSAHKKHTAAMNRAHVEGWRAAEAEAKRGQK